MNSKKCFFNPAIKCTSKPNIIKTRDDACPICFIKENECKYSLCEHHVGCSWAKQRQTFEENILKERIEPWLTSLFQSEHFSLFISVAFVLRLMRQPRLCFKSMTVATLTLVQNFTRG